MIYLQEDVVALSYSDTKNVKFQIIKTKSKMSLGGDSITQNSHEDSNEGSAILGGHGPQMLQAQQHQFGGYSPPAEVEVPLHPNVLNPPPMENNQHMVRSPKVKKLKKSIKHSWYFDNLAHTLHT